MKYSWNMYNSERILMGEHKIYFRLFFLSVKGWSHTTSPGRTLFLILKKKFFAFAVRRFWTSPRRFPSFLSPSDQVSVTPQDGGQWGELWQDPPPLLRTIHNCIRYILGTITPQLLHNNISLVCYQYNFSYYKRISYRNKNSLVKKNCVGCCASRNVLRKFLFQKTTLSSDKK